MQIGFVGLGRMAGETVGIVANNSMAKGGVLFTDGSCVTLFDGCDAPADFAFTLQLDAEAAAQALLDQVGSFRLPQPGQAEESTSCQPGIIALHRRRGDVLAPHLLRIAARQRAETVRAFIRVGRLAPPVALEV